MLQGGVTDILTAKQVAKRLYTQYCVGSQMERSSMERMLVDTYKIMVRGDRFRIKTISPIPKILLSILTFLTSMPMAESVWKTLKL
jgi:hypothetical protein